MIAKILSAITSANAPVRMLAMTSVNPPMTILANALARTSLMALMASMNAPATTSANAPARTSSTSSITTAVLSYTEAPLLQGVLEIVSSPSLSHPHYFCNCWMISILVFRCCRRNG